MEPWLGLVLIVCIIGLVIAVVSAIMGARDMQEMGIVLILLGLLMGWPVMAIGAALLIAHQFNRGNWRE